MNNHSTKITVLMSAYNAEKYLEEAIESVLKQTLADFELIIINDCSQDKTGEIIKKYAFIDDRIKVINNPSNVGLTKSLNIGLKEARGKYVARLDADDAAWPERLAKQYEFMESNPGIVLVGAWAEIIDEKGENIGFLKGETNEILLKFKMLFSNQLTHSSIIFRTAEIWAIGGYNEDYQYVQDYELYSRLAKKYRLANQGEILVKFRTHSEAITKNQSLKEVYKNYALRVIYKNISELIEISSAEFNKLAEAVVVKNSQIDIGWSDYFDVRKILRQIKDVFLKRYLAEMSEPREIIKHYRHMQRVLFKKMLKKRLAMFYQLWQKAK